MKTSADGSVVAEIRFDWVADASNCLANGPVVVQSRFDLTEERFNMLANVFAVAKKQTIRSQFMLVLVRVSLQVKP